MAVVTGAAGGIGRAICVALAERRCDLSLVDLDEGGLRETAALVEEYGPRASVHIADVSDRGAMEALPDQVLCAQSAPDLLVNNAGVSVAGSFAETSLEDLEWVMAVNFWGAVLGCKVFLPHLSGRSEAQIVNVLSSFALAGFPTKSGYCASKFALRGFTEALRAELAGTGIGVTAVYPGPVLTRMCERGRCADDSKRRHEIDFIAKHAIAPERVAELIVRGIERDAPRVLIGKGPHAMDLMERLAPDLTGRLVARLARRLPFV